MEREPVAYLSTNGERWTVQFHGPLCAGTDEATARQIYTQHRERILNRAVADTSLKNTLKEWPPEPPIWNGWLGKWTFMPRYLCEVAGCDRWATEKQGPGPCDQHRERE